jgi:hypothetical protein
LRDFNRGNGNGLCDDLTPRTQRELARSLRAVSCDAALARAFAGDQSTYSVTQDVVSIRAGDIADVRRDADTATAELRLKGTETGRAQFQLVRGRWRLDVPRASFTDMHSCKRLSCSAVIAISLYGGR